LKLRELLGSSISQIRYKLIGETIYRERESSERKGQKMK